MATNEPTTADLAAQKKKEADKAASANVKATAEKASLYVAVNLISQIGQNGKPEDVLPGTPFYPAKVDVDHFLKHDAIRKPTEAELAMHERVERLQAESTGGSTDETHDTSTDETLG